MKIDLNEEQLRQEVTIAVPLGWLLERGMPMLGVPGEALRTEIRAERTHLPLIGEPFSNEKIDEIYAGPTLHDNETFALVLLPGDFEGSWAAAGEWAQKQGGVLPSRFDMLVLWQNLKGHFKKEWYWTSALADAAGWAWFQYFGDGYQDYGAKSSQLRARAVRRVPL